MTVSRLVPSAHDAVARALAAVADLADGSGVRALAAELVASEDLDLELRARLDRFLGDPASGTSSAAPRKEIAELVRLAAMIRREGPVDEADLATALLRHSGPGAQVLRLEKAD